MIWLLSKMKKKTLVCTTELTERLALTVTIMVTIETCRARVQLLAT